MCGYSVEGVCREGLKDNKQITLENAWVYSGLSSTELTLKYNKSVIVYTD